MKILLLDKNHPLITEQLSEKGFVLEEDFSSSYEQVLEKIHLYEGIIIRSRIPLDAHFLEKAKILNIEIEGTGKELKFKLKGSKQERYIRDGTLSKKGYYSKENIAKMVKRNKESIPKEKIKQVYEEYQKEKSDEFEMRFIIEDWQVLDETKRGIYIEVEFGINNRGIILIPYNKIEKLEDGYEVFIKRNDYFYFLSLRKFLTENYLVIVATTPEATVLPPSLIANLNPSSIAIG